MRIKIYFRALLFLTLTFIPGLAQGNLYEKAAMGAATPPGWVSILGSWDVEGRPFIKDMAYTTRWNPKMFAYTSRPNQIQFDDPTPGYSQTEAGIDIVGQSEGSAETWSAHVPLLINRITGGPFKSYRIVGPGRKGLPGKLEAEGPEAPRLRIWEEGATLRWEVSVGWQIQVDITVDEGESWALLGTGMAGQADLKRFQGQDSLVRVQAFRGLKCYLDIFVPGKGILDDPRPYLFPSFFQGDAATNGYMSTNPAFEFTPATYGPNLRGYHGKAKVRWDLKKLPFDIAKLFPKRTIQMVFQAEWLNPPAPKDRSSILQMGSDLLRDPRRTKGLMLHRVTQEAKGWKVEDLGPLYTGDPNLPELRISGGGSEKGSLKNEGVDFSSYFVITSD